VARWYLSVEQIRPVHTVPEFSGEDITDTDDCNDFVRLPNE
jgi:hypothetical protein